MNVLIIEEEPLLAKSMEELLEEKGYHVEVVSERITGQEFMEMEIYDLMIIDSKLSGLSGCCLTRKLRGNRCGIPVLMLAEQNSEADRVACLDSGADHTLAKPFTMRELLACVNALLRRQGNQVDFLHFGNTYLILSSGMLVCGEKTVRLTSREFEVMRLLLQNPERNHSKEMLLAHVWGYDSNAVDNHVEVYVGFLRKKLRSIDSNLRIVAVRRLGYHLEETVDLYGI